MKKKVKKPSAPRRARGPVLPPEQKRPLYRAANTDGVNWVTDVYARALGSLHAIIRSDCCVGEDGSHTLDAVQAALRELSRLSPEEPTTEQACIKLAKTALAIGEKLTRKVSPKQAPGIAFADRLFRTGHQLAPSPVVPIFAISVEPGGQVPIPPNEAARILAELIRILENAIRQASGADGNLARARELLEFLRRYRAAVAEGGAVTLSELSAFLRPFLAELLAILRGLLSREAWISLGRALVGVCEELAAYLGGTACAAPVALLWYLVAILAAAGLGYLIGRLIGSIRIGDQTVDDHLADFFYWLLYAPPEGCDQAYACYVTAQERTRQLEAAGAANEAIISALSEAIYCLSRYIDLECEENMRVYIRTRDRLVQKLQALVE